MKKFFKYMLPAALALTAVACADHRSDYMEDFQTMVYFRNGGEQSLTLFRTGENGTYAIPVCKSGVNLKGEATAELMPFTEAQMTIYNISKETDYKLIPADKFRFVDASGNALSDQSKVKLTFGPDDAYQVVNISLNTVEISALRESDPESEYVLGFQLFSEGNVSDQINLIVLRPDIDIPTLSLVSPGIEVHKYTSASQMSETYHNTVSLNMDENRWDFDCALAVMDEAWLKEYNNANSTHFELLPAGAYRLSADKVSFKAGETEVGFDVTINRDGMDMLKEYALPVVLTSCSKPEFSIDGERNAYILNVRLDPDQITLTADMVTVSAEQDGDGEGAPALVDGEPFTYWHSPWSSFVSNPDPVYGVYIDIALKSPLKAIVINYCTRAQNGNGIPTHVVVGVSNDGSTWTELGDVATEEMASATTGQWITLPVMKHTSTFRYIRLGIAESVAGDLRQTYTSGTQPWTSLGEIELYGTDN